MPFILDSLNAIILPTKWGDNATEYYMRMDNHAPTGTDSAHIHTIDFKELGKVSINKKSADGKKFKQRFYSLSQLRIGDLAINDVAFLQLPAKSFQSNRNYIGYLGNNVLSQCALMIDFKNSLLHFASKKDTLSVNLSDFEPLDVTFSKSDQVTFNSLYINGLNVQVELDIGYNGAIYVDNKNFDRLNQNEKVTTKSGEVGTGSGISSAEFRIMDSAATKIGNMEVKANVHNNNKVAVNVLGVGMLSKFEAILIDYPNKKFYVSKALR